MIPHRAEVRLEGIEVFDDYLVASERTEGMPRIRVRSPLAERRALVGAASPRAGSSLSRGAFGLVDRPEPRFDHDDRCATSTRRW